MMCSCASDDCRENGCAILRRTEQTNCDNPSHEIFGFGGCVVDHSENEKVINKQHDFELLKQAAKAIGIHVKQGQKIAIDGKVWNPLENDADALRLAVKLRMHVFAPDAEPTAVARIYPNGPRCEEDAGIDSLAAVRRAIVRCAAESAKE